jgi:hypothetical protein
LVLVLLPYRDLANLAVHQSPVHLIGRSFELGIYESNDLTAEFRDKSASAVAQTPVPHPLLGYGWGVDHVGLENKPILNCFRSKNPKAILLPKTSTVGLRLSDPVYFL